MTSKGAKWGAPGEVKKSHHDMRRLFIRERRKTNMLRTIFQKKQVQSYDVKVRIT